MEDCDSYVKYPKHRKWFNKLWLAEMLGYKCGPAGTDIPEDGVYVVRPIYNLGGMGAGAKVVELKKDDYTSVPPGYFWCEYFNDLHYSGNYRFVSGQIPYWEPIGCWQGTNFPINLSKFTEWRRVSLNKAPKVSREFNELFDVAVINVEFIGDKPIEVHLRKGADPDYDVMIPVWKSSPQDFIAHHKLHGYEYIEAYDDANKQIDDPRLGFMVK